MQILKRYWKRLAAVCLMCICLLTLTGCPPSSSSEEYTERDEYAAGEIIRVYERETGIRLGTLVITNVTVIRDAPYTKREYLCEKNEYINYDRLYTDDQISTVGNKVYLTIEYAAVVQIDFEEDTLDENYAITADNFEIKDCAGEYVDMHVNVEHTPIPGSENSVVVGITEKGNIYLDYSYFGYGERLCTIVCEYDAATGTYIVVEDNSQMNRCTACNKEIDYDDAYCKYCGQKQK